MKANISSKFTKSSCNYNLKLEVSIGKMLQVSHQKSSQIFTPIFWTTKNIYNCICVGTVSKFKIFKKTERWSALNNECSFSFISRYVCASTLSTDRLETVRVILVNAKFYLYHFKWNDFFFLHIIPSIFFSQKV